MWVGVGEDYEEGLTSDKCTPVLALHVRTGSTKVSTETIIRH